MDAAASILSGTTLNPQQCAAASAGNDPLLIIAGAGTGKTNTLAHRVACLIARGVDPGRILLLTFTRRAAAEMLKRVENILGDKGTRRRGDKAIGMPALSSSPCPPVPLSPCLSRALWSGTFHAIANRLLRLHAGSLGITGTFTVLDRSDATNAVIALCPKRYNKDLFSTRVSRQKPRLVTLMDEEQQSEYLIKRILEHHEAGIALRKQAVLFRAAHHSDALEVELSRRNIPFVKYGGLKFLEAAHVKDVLCVLRLADNPRDTVSAFRVLQLLDGVGPAHAKRAMQHLQSHGWELKSWLDFAPPAAASEQWRQFVELLVRLAPDQLPLAEQVAEVRKFYAPILAKRYDQAEVRLRDIEQLEQIAGNFRSRTAMLADLALDPPQSTQDLAGPPLREEDYLILSTIHSAKGCEWDCVYVIHAADGNIPSDMSTGSEQEVEEERRLFYVALTRAKDFLEVCFPLKYYQKKWSTGDRHSYAQLTRFLPGSIVHHFERVKLEAAATAPDCAVASQLTDAVRTKIAAMWS